ncbi:DEAD/DEAH box helicase [Aliamphritea hakodatensis]|uniref:DEAD/DEAH box helicase n=1 Tax=Aliamphritea hakodatensis TaxID=2895352 RepID=UPI0022FD5D1A|nr:DEAD/DEAH box helicase [Aliamphritea hakodatensis]
MSEQTDNFPDLGLDHRLLQNLEHQAITTPTEIQAQSIPLALAGHDLIASSKTGSGKTLAFLLPMMHRLVKTRALSKRDPRAVILAPTRELAKQVFTQLRALTSGGQTKIALLLGGENFNEQVKALRKDPHVVVATPGRLANHLEERSLQLNGLELLIMDEADRMLDLGFAEQLTLINKAADHRLRQTLMFSATLDHAEVDSMADQLLKSPKRVAIGAANAEHKDITQEVILCDHLDHKEALLQNLLNHREYQQAIIFTATRTDTERLSALLQAENISCAALSGEMSQAERNRIMDGFSRGHQQVLVTTDVASRGLDLLQVSLVINFDMPKQAEEYVHRIGRTGRAGAKGEAVSFVGPKDWDAFKRIERFLQRHLQRAVVEGLEAKFKGIKPAKPAKKAAPGKAPVAAKPKPKAKPKQDQRSRRQAKPSLVSDDGLAPLKKKR